MEEKEYKGYTPDYIDRLLPSQVFVFGSNTLGYHTGGASGTARKKFGAVWGQAEGLQGQSYAIPVDFGKGIRKDTEVKASVDKFIAFAKENEKLFFFVTRIGCGIGGYRDEEMAQFFKEALEVKNICLPKSFVDALKSGEVVYDLDRFVNAQDSETYTYADALNEIKEGHKQGHWIWYVFPQIKGLGHSYKSEFYGISSKEEAKVYLEHPILGKRLRDITQALLDCNNPSAFNILGFPDVLKVQSCMTLFDMVSPCDIFNNVLDRYYEGKRCEKTIKRMGFRDEKNKNAIKISRLTIAKDCTILLSDYQKEVKMEPIVKTIYLLYLKHPEGIAFKCLPDYRKELANIYQKIKPFGLTERAIRSIEDVTNPLLNSINEKCSRVRAAFQSEVDPTLLEQYIITGKSGEVKKVMLSRDFVVWE
jgi:uncharacterized protein (DUF1810 family)